MAQPIDQPALRHDLHPGADTGRAGANPHQTEIAILKCFKYPAKELTSPCAPRVSGVALLSSHEPLLAFLDSRAARPLGDGWNGCRCA